MIKSKILIIEDDLIIANDIATILEDKGYQVQIGCKRSDEAIYRLKKERYDLVIIDYYLAYKTKGCEIGYYLLKNTNIPYLYITSTFDDFDIDSMKETRPFGVIFKPYQAEEITAIVSIILHNQQHIKLDIFRNEAIPVDNHPETLNNVIDYIRDNISNKIELKKLNQLTPWSYDHFIKIFQKYLNTTPYKYILQKKIEKSKILLTSTDLPINEIAFTLSFESYSNFFKAFKKVTNCTPNYYRKINKIKKSYF